MDILPAILGPDALGWAAALLTLLTFFSADMRRLRLLALAGNAAFIAYGSMAHLLPVLVLHLMLVPVNLWRLNQTFRRDARAEHTRPVQAQREARPSRGWTAKRRAWRGGRRAQKGRMAARTTGSDTPPPVTPRARLDTVGDHSHTPAHTEGRPS